MSRLICQRTGPRRRAQHLARAAPNHQSHTTYHYAMSQYTIKSASARALKRVLDEDIFTVAEIAEVAECSQRHIYKVVDETETTELSAPKLERVARYLSKHGEYRVSYALLAPDLRIVRALQGTVNGTVTDDVMDVIKAATAIDDAIEQDVDVAEARRCVNDIRHELTDLEAELAALGGRQ